MSIRGSASIAIWKLAGSGKLDATRRALNLAGAPESRMLAAAAQFSLGYHLRLLFLWSRAARRHWYRSFGYDEDAIRSVMWAPTGTVLVVPHLGDFDIAGAWLAEQLGLQVSVVIEDGRKCLDQRIYNLGRRRSGVRVLWRSQVGMAELEAELRDGHVLVLMVDRACRGPGVPVTFFGRPARVTVSPALLALRCDARLVVAATTRVGPHRRVVAAEVNRAAAADVTALMGKGGRAPGSDGRLGARAVASGRAPGWIHLDSGEISRTHPVSPRNLSGACNGGLTYGRSRVPVEAGGLIIIPSGRQL